MARQIKDDKFNIIKNDIERIRAVPTMYIASLGELGVFHLCKEIIDNNYDECYKKDSPGDHIDIVINENEMTTRDNGRGIPIEIIREVFETIQAGSNMEKAGGETRGINGFGTTAVLALSSYLEVTTMRSAEKKKYTIVYRDSVFDESASHIESYDGVDHGLIVKFRPSKKALGVNKIPVERLENWLKDCDYTLPTSISMTYTICGKKHDVQHKELPEYFVIELGGHESLFHTPLTFECDGSLTETHLDKTYNRHFRVKASIVYTNPETYKGEDLRCSWMNTINTVQHGSHMDGVINGFSKYITEKVYAKNKKLDGENLTKDILAHINVVVKADADLAHMFSAQAKDRVLSKQLQNAISDAVYKKLTDTYDSSVAEMVDIIIGNHRARIEGEKARTANSLARDKKKWNMPDQYYPCSTVKTDMPKEIFLVEGDSAGGGLKLARDAKYQAILTFKGKSLNVEKNGIDAVRALQSIPLLNLTHVLGCGIGDSFDIKKLKFGKVFISTDADIDGYHIRTILLTFFLRFMPELIRQGYVYIVEPPLYELKLGKDKMYVASPREYRVTCINSIGNIKISFPTKKDVNINTKTFVDYAFDYRSKLVEVSYDRYINRYLLEFIALGLVQYGSADNMVKNIDKWIRSLVNIFPEMRFDHDNNQLCATVDLVDQLVVIDDKLYKDLEYVINIINEYGLTIQFSDKSNEIVDTTLLRFFEYVEDRYPKILQRYKGLGSSQPKITREIITDPRTRRTIKVTMDNVNTYARISDLMGDSKENIKNRKELMMNFEFTKDMLDN